MITEQQIIDTFLPFSPEKIILFGSWASGQADEYSDVDFMFLQIDKEAKRLDRFYISARYPNGLPGLSPFEVYSAQDSAEAYVDLEKIMKVRREFLKEKTRHTPPAMTQEPSAKSQ